MLIPQPAKAVQSGVTVTVYNNYWYNAAPPLPDVSGRPVVGTLIQSQVYNNFDQSPLFNMYEDFIVKYEGFITPQETGELRFYAPADDGVKLYFNDVLVINDWYDKGGGGSISTPTQVTAGVSYPFTLWFYENGGGAWVELNWLTTSGWELVPELAFTTEPVIPTTTTSSTTTTTEAPTTTTSSTTTTAVPSTTSQPPTTTTSSSTTSVPETTTTTSSTTTSTSTSVPLPIGTTTSTQIPSTTTSVATSTSTTTTSTTVSASTTTIPAVETPLQDIPAEKVAEAVISQIEDATDEELETFFEELNMAALTVEQQNAVAEALSEAPEDVKKVFEATVNIFGEGFDSYTPVGSNVTVRERKVIIAATGVLFVAPTVSVSSSSGSQSSDSRRRA